MPYLEWQHSAYSARAELPVVPHAGGGGGHADHVGARPAAARAWRGMCSSAATSSCCGCSTDIAPTSASRRSPQELDASARRTVRESPAQTATVSVERVSVARRTAGLRRRRAEPDRPQVSDWLSRRAGRGCTSPSAIGTGRAVFESGAITPTGLDRRATTTTPTPTKFEPHYTEIREPDQVQIYESIMGDPAGRPTTGLLTRCAISRTTGCCRAASTRRRAEPDIAGRGQRGAGRDFRGRRRSCSVLGRCRRRRRAAFRSTSSCVSSRSAFAGRRT